MDASLITTGAHAPVAALTLNRVALGTLFANQRLPQATQRFQARDTADWRGDLLYLPEALYCIGLAVVMLAGPVPWSLDAFIATLLVT